MANQCLREPEPENIVIHMAISFLRKFNFTKTRNTHHANINKTKNPKGITSKSKI